MNVPRSRFRGEIFLLYLFLYGIARFVLEEFRADTPAILAVGRSALSLPQLTGLGMALVSAALILAAGRRRQGA